MVLNSSFIDGMLGGDGNAFTVEFYGIRGNEPRHTIIEEGMMIWAEHYHVPKVVNAGVIRAQWAKVMNLDRVSFPGYRKAHSA